MKKTISIIAILCAMSLGGYHLTHTAIASPHDHDKAGQEHSDDTGDGHAHAEEPAHAHAEGKDDNDNDHGEDDGHAHEEEGAVKMDAAQMAKAGITTVTVTPTAAGAKLQVTGQIVLADDRKAVVTPRVAGTVQKVFKNVGDTVAAGEAIAVIESPAMAEATAEFLAAKRAEELARTVLSREEKLWKEKVTAEQDYLTARNARHEAKIRLDLAAQKLRAAGQDPAQAQQGSTYTLTAPLAGRVIRRDLTLGAYVDSTQIAFEIADTSILWVAVGIPASDITSVDNQQNVTVTTVGQTAAAQVIFISPAIDTTTGTAKVVVALANPDGAWRAGTLANVVFSGEPAATGLSVPASSVLTVAGKTCVFIKTDTGFLLREITTGQKNGDKVTVTKGLNAGETIAAGNVFILKAELGKAEAEHAH